MPGWTKMADYKDVIKGTASAVAVKTREFVSGGGLRELYLGTSAMARCHAAIASLTLKINGELESQKAIFAEIGRQYFDQCGGVGDGRFAALFEELRASDGRIEAMRSELEAAKTAIEAHRESKKQ